ncbi:hypothetical protein DRN75_00935 [Nanoarchaeota archaeon]|nr:MAG: hypothetical protein DRN75_00935 [Nanoarchaeota archaeon]
MPRYTLEELMEISGYSSAMIYDLTHKKILTPPVRGIEPDMYGSKGSYAEECIEQIKEYKKLKFQGLKKAEIIAKLKRS